MSNQLEVMKQLQALLPAAARAKAAQGGNINEAFSGGITSGFGVLSIRGKVWRQKYQGEERIVMDDDQRTPRPGLHDLRRGEPRDAGPAPGQHRIDPPLHHRCHGASLSATAGMRSSDGTPPPLLRDQRSHWTATRNT